MIRVSTVILCVNIFVGREGKGRQGRGVSTCTRAFYLRFIIYGEKMCWYRKPPDVYASCTKNDLHSVKCGICVGGSGQICTTGVRLTSQTDDKRDGDVLCTKDGKHQVYDQHVPDLFGRVESIDCIGGPNMTVPLSSFWPLYIKLIRNK